MRSCLSLANEGSRRLLTFVTHFSSPTIQPLRFIISAMISVISSCSSFVPSGFLQGVLILLAINRLLVFFSQVLSPLPSSTDSWCRSSLTPFVFRCWQQRWLVTSSGLVYVSSLFSNTRFMCLGCLDCRGSSFNLRVSLLCLKYPVHVSRVFRLPWFLFQMLRVSLLCSLIPGSYVFFGEFV